METKKITIDNVGAISHLEIPVPEKGGIIVLEGRNGSGKSTGINAVAGLTSKTARDKLSPQDTYSAGKVTGYGVTLRVGKSRTIKGKLEAVVEGGEDLASFVDPRIKDPHKRDDERLKVVMRLTNATIAADEWQTLLGNEISEQIDIDNLIDESDPVATSDRIRRAVHKLALEAENQSKLRRAEATGLLQSIDGIELDVECDVETQKAELRKITNFRHEAMILNEKAKEENARIDEAQAKLEELNFDGVGDLESQYEKGNAELNTLEESINTAQRSLNSLKRKFETKEIEQQKLELKVEAAKDRQSQYEACKSLIDRPMNPITDIETIDTQLEALTDQLAAMVEIEKAKAVKEKCDEIDQEAENLAKRGKELREVARLSDKPFDDALKNAGMKIFRHDGRLATNTDRGVTLVDDLSHAERQMLILDTLQSGETYAYGQEPWEGLDPINRAKLAEMVRDRGITLITGQSTAGGLEAKVFEPEMESVS